MTDETTRKKISGRLGVIIKNVAMIRERPESRAELATQAIIGQPVVVEGGQKDWLFVQAWDTCRGWIAAESVRILDEGSRAYASTGPVAVVRDLIVDALQEPSELAPVLTKLTISAEIEVAASEITPNSAGRLLGKPPTLDESVTCWNATFSQAMQVGNRHWRLEDWVEIAFPDERSGFIRKHQAKLVDKDLAQTMWLPRPEKLVETAGRFIGTPYLWGGTTPFGLDCSGFVQLIYRVHGVTLLRNSSSQAGDPRAESVEKSDLRAGDLVFFAKSGRPDIAAVSHVGMAISRDKFIHSRGGSGVIISSLDDPYYAGIYWGARRLRLATLDPGGGAPED